MTVIAIAQTVICLTTVFGPIGWLLWTTARDRLAHCRRGSAKRPLHRPAAVPCFRDEGLPSSLPAPLRVDAGRSRAPEGTPGAEHRSPARWARRGADGGPVP